MTTVDFTIALFCRVDDVLCDQHKHPLLEPLKARLAYTCALCNLCFDWNGQTTLQLAQFKL